METAIAQDDILAEYIVDVRKHLNAVEHDLALLEIDPENRHIFRRLRETLEAIHAPTDMLGLEKVRNVAAEGTALIDRLALGEVSTHPVMLAALSNMLTALREIIGTVESEESEGEESVVSLCTLLRSLQAADFTRLLEPPTKPTAIEAAPSSNEIKDTSAGSVKVERATLELLQRLTGELVTTRNQLAFQVEGHSDPAIQKISAELDRITSEFFDATRPFPVTGPVAVIRAFAFSSGADYYLLPQLSVREHLVLDREGTERSVEFLFETPVFRFEGNLLPLVTLEEVLRSEQPRPVAEQDLHIVVVEHEGGRFGLIVDDAQGVSEVVLQPLDEAIGREAGIWGGAIMADGHVALMLNPGELAERIENMAAER